MLIKIIITPTSNQPRLSRQTSLFVISFNLFGSHFAFFFGCGVSSVGAGGGGFLRALALNETQLIWAAPQRHKEHAQKVVLEPALPACTELGVCGFLGGVLGGPLGGVSAPKYNPADLRKGPLHGTLPLLDPDRRVFLVLCSPNPWAESVS